MTIVHSTHPDLALTHLPPAIQTRFSLQRCYVGLCKGHRTERSSRRCALQTQDVGGPNSAVGEAGGIRAAGRVRRLCADR